MSHSHSQLPPVPDDFPDLPAASGLAGAKVKFSMSEYEGKFYVPGNSPPERHERWLACEDLAETFSAKCLQNEHGKYQHLTRAQILEQYCVRLLETYIATALELQWVIRRVADLLGWPTPPSAGVEKKGKQPLI